MVAEGKNDDGLALLRAHQKTTIEQLIDGCPEWLQKFMHYVKELEFYEKPNYKYIIQIFNEELKAKKFKLEEETWDWDIQREKIIKYKIKQEEMER